MNKNILTNKITCFLYSTALFVTGAQAQNVVKIQSGASITTTGGAVITLQDMNLDNDGTINQAAGAGSFVFSGTTNNFISGTAQPLFDVLQIAKTGSATLSLQQHIQIGSQITFTSGLINGNTQRILLQPTALLNNESETSRITGINGGYVEITNSLNAPSMINPGNLGAFITSAQNLGSVTIRRGHQSQISSSGGGNSIFRYYDIIPANNTALHATLRFSYFDAELNGLDENSLTLIKRLHTLNWTNQGFTTRNTSGNHVQLAGISDFARFTLSSPGNALPLLWNSFNTQCVSNQVRISWKTDQEQNTASFVIRRSPDGRSWTTIAIVAAAGNSNLPLNYSYTDPQSLPGTSFYQVQEQDMDGRQVTSPVLTNQCQPKEELKIFPNPVEHTCWVSMQSANNQAIQIRLYDARGALMKLQTENIQAGNNLFILRLNDFAPGIYSLAITRNDGKVEVIRLQKK